MVATCRFLRWKSLMRRRLRTIADFGQRTLTPTTESSDILSRWYISVKNEFAHITVHPKYVPTPLNMPSPPLPTPPRPPRPAPASPSPNCSRHAAASAQARCQPPGRVVLGFRPNPLGNWNPCTTRTTIQDRFMRLAPVLVCFRALDSRRPDAIQVEIVIVWRGQRVTGKSTPVPER